jgi:hypothetical protein
MGADSWRGLEPQRNLSTVQDEKRKQPFFETTFFMRFDFVRCSNPSLCRHLRTAAVVVFTGWSLPDDKNSAAASSVKRHSGGKFGSAQDGQ